MATWSSNSATTAQASNSRSASSILSLPLSRWAKALAWDSASVMALSRPTKGRLSAPTIPMLAPPFAFHYPSPSLGKQKSATRRLRFLLSACCSYFWGGGVVLPVPGLLLLLLLLLIEQVSETIS